MKVTVDSGKCQGHTLCNVNAPQVFDLSSDGYAEVIVDVVPPEHEEAVRAAALSCPEQAIRIED